MGSGEADAGLIDEDNVDTAIGCSVLAERPPLLIDARLHSAPNVFHQVARPEIVAPEPAPATGSRRGRAPSQSAVPKLGADPGARRGDHGRRRRRGAVL